MITIVHKKTGDPITYQGHPIRFDSREVANDALRTNGLANDYEVRDV